MPDKSMFGAADPTEQFATQVRAREMAAMANEKLARATRIQGHRLRGAPLDDPHDFEKRVMKKPQVGNAVRQGEMANMQQKGNLPRYGNSDLGAPQVIDALRMRGGVGPTAQQWGFPDRPAIDPGAFTLAMMLQQRQRNAPGSLGRMVPNLAGASGPAQPEPVYRPFDPVLAANIQSKNAKIRADKKANRSQADLDAEAMQLAQNRQEYLADRANKETERGARVAARQQARGDIKNFGIDPEQAYWNRGVPMGGQMSPEQRTMLMLKQGQAMGLPQEAVNQMAFAQQYKEARLAQEEQNWMNVLGQPGQSPAVIEIAQNNLARIQAQRAGARGPLQPIQAAGPAITAITPEGREQQKKDFDDAIKEGKKGSTREMFHGLVAAGMNPSDAADMVRKHHPWKEAKHFEPERMKTPYAGIPGTLASPGMASFFDSIATSPSWGWLMPQGLMDHDAWLRWQGLPASGETPSISR